MTTYSNDYVKNLTKEEIFDEAQELLEKTYQLVLEMRSRHLAYTSRGVGPEEIKLPQLVERVDEYAGLPQEIDE